MTREESNGVVLSYEMKHTKNSIRGGMSTPEYQNTTNTFVTLRNLTSCSHYSVHVRAYTSAGPGPFGGLPSEIATSGMYHRYMVKVLKGERDGSSKVARQEAGNHLSVK